MSYYPPPGSEPEFNTYDPPKTKPNKTLLIALGSVGGVIVLCCGLGGVVSMFSEEDSASDDTEVSASTSPPQETVTVTESAETTAASPTPTPTEDRSTDEVGSQEQAEGDTFPMPDEVGKVLQVAQDDLQAISGSPFFVSFSEDASGQDRFQALDSNWIVCSQDPQPGTPVAVDNSTDVTFFVVKTDEDCP